MADVDASWSLEGDESGKQRLHDQFRESKWFTRGWTLQELLAPRRRVFYNTKWEGILDLSQNAPPSPNPLFQDILRVTSITPHALHSFSSTSPEFSVARKMAWASKRNTTRVEDIAYCLMGIFDVNMPLLYGEGSKAFLRLQEEIIRKSNDHSIFYWGARAFSSGSSYRVLLARSPAEFQYSQGFKPWSNREADVDVSSLTWENETDKGTVFGMTNRGLRITLPLYPRHPSPGDLILAAGEFYTLLHCTCLDSEGPVVLLLAHLGNGNFARIGHCIVDPSSTKGEATTKEIFVQQNIDVGPSYVSPRLRKFFFRWSEGSHFSKRFRIVNMIPNGPRLGLWVDVTQGEWYFKIKSKTVDRRTNSLPIVTITFEQTLQNCDIPHVYFAISLRWTVKHRTFPGRMEVLTPVGYKFEFVDPPPGFAPVYELLDRDKRISALCPIRKLPENVLQMQLNLDGCKSVLVDDALVLGFVTSKRNWRTGCSRR